MNFDAKIICMRGQGLLSDLDIHFAEFMGRLAVKPSNGLKLGALLVSRMTQQGNVCVSLEEHAGKPLFEDEDSPSGPELKSWRMALMASGVVSDGSQPAPLVLDDFHRLYLYRYWDYQSQLAHVLKGMIGRGVDAVDHKKLQSGLNRLFPHPPEGGIDWQKIAAATAVLKRFGIITGGPGTGKTYTVVGILALLLEQNPNLNIKLAAPTGKAASRLQEVIQNTAGKLDCSHSIRALIPTKAETIHRLLGGRPDSVYFKHNRENRLNVDLLVLDEGSMVGVALMSKLVQALPDHGRLILLGDKDQLPPVEAGSILGELCRDSGGVTRKFRDEIQEVTGMDPGSMGQGDRSGLKDVIVQLHQSRRFDPNKGIGALARAIREGEGETAMGIMNDAAETSVSWSEISAADQLKSHLSREVFQGFGDIQKSNSVHEALALFDRYRILCAHRNGLYGVYRINDLVEEILRSTNTMDQGEWYKGRPVMVVKNDYDLGLFNGDIGMVWPDMDGESGENYVYFRMEGGEIKKMEPSRLPGHETVYAMTLHKSQGSEFDRVLILLPPKPSRVVTRELVYTGITRAKEGVEIWGDEHVFKKSLFKGNSRVSGLLEMLS